MDRAGFRAWLLRYVDAWRLNDPVAVGDLFSPDVRYAFDPFDEAVAGRNAVIEAWLDDPDDRHAAYALEGAIFIAGAAVQWLRDGLGLVRAAGETQALAESVADTGGVYFVPAFVGLGAPYWDQYARGTIVGVVGIGMLISSLSGIYLWWPAGRPR